MQLHGIELRYVVTMYLFDSGPASIADMVDALTRQGFSIRGRASKTVSDALRWEVEHGRVFRRGRGRYGPAWMPRSTEYRIHRRVRALRAAARLSLEGGHTAHSLGAGTGGADVTAAVVHTSNR